MEIKLRDYQEKAIEAIRDVYATRTKKVLLKLPTGAGKTVIFTYIVLANQEKGKTCFVVTRGRELVFNAYRRMQEGGVDCGIIMAGQPLDYTKKVQVISIDTLLNRLPDLTYRPDLIVIDEAHFAASLSWKKLASIFPDSYYLAVTATPYQQGSLRHVADEIITPCSHQDLVSAGYLVPSKVFAPTKIDLSAVKTTETAVGRDYREDDLFKAMDHADVYADVLKYYVSTAQKSSALCFCVNVSHSKYMTEIFRANGLRAAHAAADTPDWIRKKQLRELASGDLDVICNCNIFATGIDIPSLRTVIMCRPTQSRILMVQQAGRGTRPADDKEFFWLMDHANNTAFHGFIEDDGHDDDEGAIDGASMNKREKNTSPPIKTCPDCFAVLLVHVRVCPQCAHVFISEGKDIKVDEDLSMKELTRGELLRIDYARVETYFRELEVQAAIYGYKRGWLYYKLKGKFGQKVANKFGARIFAKKDSSFA